MEESHVLFGKYEVGRMLGKGTFAKVYYGKHTLVADPVKRITIPGIARILWFRKGFSRPVAFSIQESDKSSQEPDDKMSPKFFNAFEFISSMSSGFDLSNLFEKKRKAGSMFTSKCSADAVVAKIECVAKNVNFKVAKVKNFKVWMQGQSEGRKGRLAVTAEVFEVAPEVTVVEIAKSSGDTLEYAKFFEEDVRPALKDIVWSWQGESNGNGQGEEARVNDC